MHPPPEDIRRPIRYAQARASGIGPRELEGPLWRRAFHDVYVWAAVEFSPSQRIFEAAQLLPSDGAVGGWAACYLLGAQGLDGRRFTGPDIPVPLVIPPWRQIDSRLGIAVLRTAIAEQDVVDCAGIPVTTPLCATFTHMRMSDLESAVVGGDAVLNARLVEEDELRAYVASHPRVKGAPIARRAVELVDGRSRSPQESVLRLVWRLEADLPRPMVNTPVYSDLGHLLGIPDLLDKDSGLVAEYDGAQHREAAQHSSDNAREEQLERAGLTVVRITSVDLAHQRRRVVHRLRMAYRDGLARDRRRDRWSLLPTPAWVTEPPARP